MNSRTSSTSTASGTPGVSKYSTNEPHALPNPQPCHPTEPPSIGPIERLTIVERLQSGWTMEIISLVSAFGLFGVYLCLLQGYDQKSPYDWYQNPLSMLFGTLPSFLSQVGTLLRLTMGYPVASAMGQLKWQYLTRPTPRRVADLRAFDDASRGISGSIRLLFSKNALHSLSLGCIFILAGISLGPATQNSIVPENRWATAGYTDLYAPTISYSSYYSSPAQTVGAGGSEALDANITMQASILAGWAYDINPTENNARGTHRLDISSQELGTEDGDNPEVEYHLRIGVFPDYCPSSDCYWERLTTLAVRHECVAAAATSYGNGTARSEQADVSNRVEVGDSVQRNAFIRLKPSTKVPASSRFISHSNNPALLVHVSAVYTADGLSFSAAECVLYWEVVALKDLFYEDSSAIWVRQAKSATKEAHDLGTGNITFFAPCNEGLNKTSCSYDVDKTSHRGVQNFLGRFLNGHAYHEGPANATMPRVDSIATKLFTASLAKPPDPTDPKGPLHSRLDTYMSNVAFMMTKNIRKYSGLQLVGKSKPSGGVMTVRWKYTLYPALMLALSSFLLASTMWRTRGLPTWKSSPLPFLYHGFERPSDCQTTDFLKLAYMEKASRAQYVVLRDDDDGLGLKLRTTT